MPLPNLSSSSSSSCWKIVQEMPLPSAPSVPLIIRRNGPEEIKQPDNKLRPPGEDRRSIMTGQERRRGLRCQVLSDEEAMRP